MNNFYIHHLSTYLRTRIGKLHLNKKGVAGDIRTKASSAKVALTLLACGICFVSFTQRLSAQNLVANGDFSLGNTGFASDYNFTSINSSQNQYTVSSNPNAWNGAFLSPPTWFDHSPSSDNLSLLVNGSVTAGEDVWRESFTGLTPNTNYTLSAWASNLSPGNAPNPVLLQFFVNGAAIGSQFTVGPGAPNWQQFAAVWNPGASTTATISIRDANTDLSPNDFALDDISVVGVPEPSSAWLVALGLMLIGPCRSALRKSRRT
jgi:hypothetical protein